ncbi:lipoprotein [Naasia aerilata]|uniref:Lipoprotein n=1 Tax=Naasia aerilata TaxID=1162966 RepID=A0ABM8GCL8_9MICO|nr:lipoprotein [Naasia aerilata]
MFVILLGVLDLALAASPRAVTITRELPGRIRLGESADAQLLLTNTGRRTLRAVVRDAWQPSAGSARSRVPLTIPPGERRSALFRLTPFRRGERRTEQVTIRAVGPLGLWARQATLAAPGAVRVLPPFNSRRHLPSRLARLRELDGRTSVMIRGQGTEFDSLREYVRGDDVRSIDWRATARRGPARAGQQVMVRTWRPERDRRVVLVLDSGRTSAARVEDEPRLDTAFEAALLLAALATRAGDRIDLLAFDRRVRARVQGVSGAELLSRMVDAMAPLEPDLIETDWTAVPGQVRSITSQRSLVVLLTSIDASGSSRGLLSVLPQLTRRHMVVVASVTDPQVLASTQDRHDRDSVYRAAAAERSLLDTARVAAAIRQLGAEVVTGSPADLPPALADRYLALKAAGRL